MKVVDLAAPSCPFSPFSISVLPPSDYRNREERNQRGIDLKTKIILVVVLLYLVGYREGNPLAHFIPIRAPQEKTRRITWLVVIVALAV